MRLRWNARKQKFYTGWKTPHRLCTRPTLDRSFIFPNHYFLQPIVPLTSIGKPSDY